MQPVMDDTVLLRAFQQGDGWAEKKVFDRFFEPLVLFSERMTGDVLASEDIVVEVLTKAIVGRNLRGDELEKKLDDIYKE